MRTNHLRAIAVKPILWELIRSSAGIPGLANVASVVGALFATLIGIAVMVDKAEVLGGLPSTHLGDDLAALSPSGSWRGEAVRLKVPEHATLLTHAKEELTFARSEEMESKKIDQRKISERNMGLPLAEIREADEYFERLPFFNRAELQALLHDLRTNDPDIDGVLRKVSQRFEDPSYAYAALDIAAQELRGEGRDELAARADAARAQLIAEQGPAIRAGLNISVAAVDAAAGDRTVAADLRDFYRTTVSDAPGPARLYKELLNRFGVGGFVRQIAFLTRALGDDIGSAGPSVEPARLREILEGLSALRVLDTVHERCEEMIRRLRHLQPLEITATGVMRELLPLTEDAVSGPSRIDPIPGRLGIPAARLDMQIACLRESRALLAMMPVVIYRDLEARAAALRAVQETMDMRIEQEEGV